MLLYCAAPAHPAGCCAGSAQLLQLVMLGGTKLPKMLPLVQPIPMLLLLLREQGMRARTMQTPLEHLRLQQLARPVLRLHLC
jgi:hypothetical protein